jgi:hypothetical protein
MIWALNAFPILANGAGKTVGTGATTARNRTSDRPVEETCSDGVPVFPGWITKIFARYRND